MSLRVGVAVLLVGLLSTACGTAEQTAPPTSSQAASNSQRPTESQQPTETQPPTGTDQPTATDEPNNTEPPAPSGEPPASGDPDYTPDLSHLNQVAPLPAPELTTVDEVVQAMAEPGMEDQAIMSMLDQLGIGIYGAGGTVILAGSDQSDADFYLFEPEVRGLIDMLESQGEEPWINFTDFQQGLAAFGLQMSADELAQAYNDAYAASPDEPITRFVQANAFIAPEAQLSPLGVWLMLLDGFVPPNPSAQAIAFTGGVFVASGRSGWGVAAPRLRRLPTPEEVSSLVKGVGNAMAAQTMARSLQIMVEASPATVHEGHGGTGSPATITAFILPCGGGARTRQSGCSLPAGANLSGFNVTWNLDSTLTAHGTPSISSGAATATDASGRTTFTYTPKAETPDAHTNGHLTNAVAKVQASVPIADVIQRLYGLPPQGALFLGGSGKARYTADVVVEWHEPSALRIELINPYDVTIREMLVGGNAHQWGTDTIKGDLIVDDDGVTYRGIMIGRAKGQWTGKAYGKACSASWDTTQLLQVVATVNETLKTIGFTFAPVDAPSGRPARGRCRPTQWKSDSTGVYFAPYNDYAIIQATGLNFVMFDKPGGSADYPVPPGPPNITIKNTLWHVRMEYLDPP